MSNLSRFLAIAFMAFILVSCSGTKAPSLSGGADDEALLAKAQRIHERVLAMDTHVDIPGNFATPEADPGVRADAQVDLPKMREGGLDAAFFIVFMSQTERTPENYAKAKETAMQKFEAIHRMTDEMYPDQIGLAYTAADVGRIHASGRLVALIGIENGYAIGKDLSLLKKYHDLGGRYITLAHTANNDIADTGTPDNSLDNGQAEHDGISAFGEEVIAEMNRLGTMVDVSHISKAAMLDAVRLSKAPVIASHSSTRALNDHPRNMDDEQLLALKANGGVMQTVAFDSYVKAVSPEKTAALDDLRTSMGITSRASFAALSEEQRADYMSRRDAINAKYPGANVQDFVDHIDHAVQLIGVDHVGISSDFGGGGGITGWNNAAETLNITLELVRRGYSEDDIAKMWSGNLLRVMKECEDVAARLQGTQ